MGRFDGVLLASDYDGTLCGEKVQERDKAAIRAFQREGGIFMVVTGRCYSDFVQQSKELPLTHPSLLSNGATLCDMDSGEILFSNNLSEHATEDMIELMADFPSVAVAVYHKHENFLFQPNELSDYHSALVKSIPEERPLEEIPTPWLKAMFLGQRPELEQIRSIVLERWSDRYECIFSADCLLELTAKGIHKGNGVLRTAKSLGIDPKHIYCVGDNENDLPMLNVAATAFAPSASAVDNLGVDGPVIVNDVEHGCIESVVAYLWDRYSGENPSVRNAIPNDETRMAEIYRYYVEDTAISFECGQPLSVQGKVESTIQSGYPILVIEQNGRVMGYAYAGRFKGRQAYDWSCELSIYLDKTAHRQGLGSRLYSALEQRLKAMGIQNLYACIACPAEENDPYLTWDSKSFHEHMGFHTVGTFHQCANKFGRWYDMIWMEKVIGNHEKDPKPVENQKCAILPWESVQEQ